MNFNSTKRMNFPAIGTPGDIWFDTHMRDLYVAARPSNAFFLPTSPAKENAAERIFNRGLTIRQGLRVNVPSVAPAGTIFLTTDTFEAFAGTGPGVVKFRTDVRGALAEADPSITF